VVAIPRFHCCILMVMVLPLLTEAKVVMTRVAVRMMLRQGAWPGLVQQGASLLG
jgi:hypothetical protein